MRAPANLGIRLEGRREAPGTARHVLARLVSGFLPPPPRTVHAVLPHTAHRRPSPPAFGFTRQGLRALGEATASTHARSATSLRWTLSKSAWNRRPGSALAAR